MKGLWLLAILLSLILTAYMVAGCGQQENPPPTDGLTSSAVTASAMQTASQAVAEPSTPSAGRMTAGPAEPRLLEARAYRGADAVPPNLLVTFSKPAQLALIAEALLHKDRLQGQFSLRTPDYVLILDFGAEQEQIYLWLHDSSGSLMNRKSSTALYQFTDGYDQKLRSLIAEAEPISVYEGKSQIAVNQVTEKKKQDLVRELVSAAIWQSGPWNGSPIDQSYRFIVDGSTYLLYIADDTHTLINNSASQYRLKKSDGVSLMEALGVHLLVDYGIPLGNQHVQRYCGYIYYTMNGRLFRMRENGTGFEQLLAKSERAGRLIAQGGSLYFFSGAPDSTLYQVQTDSRVAPLLPMATRVGDVLAITEKQIYYATVPQPGKPTVTRRRSVQGKSDTPIKQENAEAAVVSAVSPSEDLLYLTVDTGMQPGSGAEPVRLVKCFPDGTLVAGIDEGMIDQLTLCGDFLAYRKTVSMRQVQIWVFDTDRATLRLLVDSSDTGTDTAAAGTDTAAAGTDTAAAGTDPAAADAVTLNIIGVDDSEASLYYAVSRSGAGSDLFSIKPSTLKRRDLAGPIALVWNGMQMRKSLLGIDLDGDWLYYAILPAIPKSGGSTAATSEAHGDGPSSQRCRLDGTSDLKFADGAGSAATAAGDPLTIGRWIYFLSDPGTGKPRLLQRYNTETGIVEQMPTGLVSQ